MVLSVLFSILALASVQVTSSIYSQGILERRIVNSCRNGLLKIQEDSSIEIERLMALNPQVRRIKIALKQARIELAAHTASGNAPAIAITKAKISILLLQLTAIKGQQSQILTTGQLRIRQELLKLKQTLDSKSREWISIGETDFVKFQFLLPLKTQWALQPTELTFPEYIPVWNFEYLQRLQIHWTWVKTGRITKDFIHPVQPTIWRKESLCGASLQFSGSSNFTAVINEAR